MRTNSRFTLFVSLVISLMPALKAFGQATVAKPAIDVSNICQDDFAAMVFNVSRITKLPAIADLLKNMPELFNGGGFRLSEVAQVTVVFPIPEKQEPGVFKPYVPVLITHFIRPVDVKAVCVTFNKLYDSNPPDLREKIIDGKTCYEVDTGHDSEYSPHDVAYSPNSMTVILSYERNIKRIIDAESESSHKSQLAQRLQKADADSCIAGAFDLDSFTGLDERIDEAKRGAPAIVANYLEAFKTLHGGQATLSMKRDSLLLATLDAKTAETADNAANLVEQGMVMAGAGMAFAKSQLTAEQRKSYAGALKMVDALIASASTKKEGSQIEFAVKRPANLDDALPQVAASVQKAIGEARAAARRVQQLNNFKQVAIAMINFADSNGHFPAAAITKDGKRLLSWRVAILPYIEQKDLYDQFHQDEPWDSPNNLPLAKKMPGIFRSPDPRDDGKTTILAFTGKDTLFEDDKGITLAQVTDGLSNTLLVVEAGPDKAVPWTKPEDLPFDPKKPLEALGKIPADGFTAAMADGSVRRLKVDNAKLKLLIMRNSGEVKSFDQ